MTPSDLPPGVTDSMIEETAGRYLHCGQCGFTTLHELAKADNSHELWFCSRCDTANIILAEEQL